MSEALHYSAGGSPEMKPVPDVDKEALIGDLVRQEIPDYDKIMAEGSQTEEATAEESAQLDEHQQAIVNAAGLEARKTYDQKLEYATKAAEVIRQAVNDFYDLLSAAQAEPNKQKTFSIGDRELVYQQALGRLVAQQGRHIFGFKITIDSGTVYYMFETNPEPAKRKRFWFGRS